MKAIVLPGIIAVFALAAEAQDSAPIAEFAGQYQMLRVNSSRNVPAFSAQGGTGSFQINFFDNLAGVLELGSQFNDNIGGAHLNNTWFTYMLGPRVSLRSRAKKVIPALELLAGGATLFANARDPFTQLQVSRNTTGFSMAAGGLLDIKVNHRIMIRPIQVDYLLTRVNNSNNQNNFRYGAGIVFTLGAQ